MNLDVNDAITIINTPSSWSSRLSENCPLKLKYPHDFEVIEIHYGGEMYPINSVALKLLSLEDGIEYGFSYPTMKGKYIKFKNDKSVYLSKNIIKYIIKCQNLL